MVLTPTSGLPADDRWPTTREIQERLAAGIPVELRSFEQDERPEDEWHRLIRTHRIRILILLSRTRTNLAQM